MRTPARILGVDFSGAQNAGRLIWIASGEAKKGRLVLDACVPAAEIAGGRTDGPAAHSALVRFLAKAGECAVGLDFPFSLPDPWLDAQTWRNFLRSFPRRFPREEDFYSSTHAAYGEQRRRTDVETRAPMAVNNLRLFRQTFHGLRDVLLPLVESEAARVLPMQTPVQGVPWLLETCPATALIAWKIRRPYKGPTRTHRIGRVTILDWLEDSGRLHIPSRRLRERIVEQTGGDALDGVLAAWIAWRTLATGWPLSARDLLERREGRIYDGSDGVSAT